jgi:hypothetical protein
MCRFLCPWRRALRQDFIKIKLFVFKTIMFLLLNHLLTTTAISLERVVNGEEVYEPKKTTNQTKTPKNEHKESNSHAPNAAETKKESATKKDTEHKGSEEKYKGNRVVNLPENDQYDIHKPKGIIWFSAVFVILLIMIFVFT